MARSAVPDQQELLLAHCRPEDLLQLLERAPELPTLAQESEPWMPPSMASSGDPEVARAVWSGTARPRWTLGQLRTLAAAADPADPRWEGPLQHLMTARWGNQGVGPALRSMVVGPFPKLIHHALLRESARMCRAEQLRALLSLFELGGVMELRAVLDDEEARGRLRLDVLISGDSAAACLPGMASLRTEVAAAESSEGLRDELRYGAADAEDRANIGIPTRRGEAGARALEIDSLRNTVSLWSEPDWAGLLTAHQDKPFSGLTAQALAGIPACPDVLRVALCDVHPDPESVLLGLSGPVPVGALAAVPPTALTPAVVAALAEQNLGRGWTAEDLLHRRIGPAGVVLRAARLQPEGPAAAAGWAEFRERLEVLVAQRLGHDPVAWRAVRKAVRRFSGSVAELLESVGGEAAGAAAAVMRAKAGGAAGAWPYAAQAPAAGAVRVPSGDRDAFLALADASAPAVQWWLLGEMDGRSVHDVLTWGRWRPEWLGLGLSAADGGSADGGAAEDDEAATRRARLLLMSRHHTLPVEAVEVLARLDDPQVNAGLLYQDGLTRRQREALLVGRRFGVGDVAEDRLPLDAELKQDLLSRNSSHWRWLIPVIGCGDRDVARHVLNNVKLNTRNLQLRWVLGIWERHGRQALRDADLIPDWFQDGVLDLIGELLDPDAPPEAEALARLHEETDSAEATKQLTRRLRLGARGIDRLRMEGFDWDWQVVLAEHLRKPFGHLRVAEFREMEGCPELVRLGVSRMSKGEQGAFRKLKEGVPAERALARMVLSEVADRREVPWVRLAVDQSLLDWADVVRHGRRASLVLAWSAENAPDARQEVAALTARYLDGYPDAWLLALRMLPDFAGTLPELLRTAALATGSEEE